MSPFIAASLTGQVVLLQHSESQFSYLKREIRLALRAGCEDGICVTRVQQSVGKVIVLLGLIWGQGSEDLLPARGGLPETHLPGIVCSPK